MKLLEPTEYHVVNVLGGDGGGFERGAGRNLAHVRGAVVLQGAAKGAERASLRAHNENP